MHFEIYRKIKRIFYDFLRNNHLTHSRWPNEYDQKIWTWPKNSRRKTLSLEYDRKCTTTKNSNEWIWPKFKKISYFGQIHLFMFVVLITFFIIYFRSYSSIFQSCSMVNVCWCNLLVKFQCLRLPLWIFLVIF